MSQPFDPMWAAPDSASGVPAADPGSSGPGGGRCLDVSYGPTSRYITATVSRMTTGPRTWSYGRALSLRVSASRTPWPGRERALRRYNGAGSTSNSAQESAVDRH